MAWLSKVLAFDPKKVDVRRALLLLAGLAALLVTVVALGARQYAMSALFGALFAVIADPGGAFASRVRRLGVFALVGAAGTALAFAVGEAFWVWPVVAVFAVTLLAGLTVRWGTHCFASSLLQNVWFVIALSLPAWYSSEHVHSDLWLQAAAWLAGVAAWLAVAFVSWLAHGRTDRPPFIPEIPSDVSRHPLTGRIVVFALARAVALALTVGLAWGLDLQNGVWMAIAAIVAMKPSLQQATSAASQRLAGALIGAVLAAGLLYAVDVKVALAVAAIALFTIAGAIRMASYAWYCAAIAAGVLILTGLPHPEDLEFEGERVVYTFAGLAVGILILGVAHLLGKVAARELPPHAAPAAGHDAAAQRDTGTGPSSGGRSTATGEYQ
jgi:uncharacterized membrane protein YccC